MKFDEWEWVNDIVTGAVTGVVGGAISAMVVPDPPFFDAMAAGGIAGLVTGMLLSPLKWLLNRRPAQNESKDDPPHLQGRQHEE